MLVLIVGLILWAPRPSSPPIPDSRSSDGPAREPNVPRERTTDSGQKGRVTKSAVQADATNVALLSTLDIFDSQVDPVQYCEPGFQGVDCQGAQGCEPRWNATRPIPWQAFGPGEYVGPFRTPHVGEYRLRPNDQMQIIFRESRERSNTAYRLNVGDEVKVESVIDKDLDRSVTIQPDGTITLRLLNQVPAAGRTVDELRKDIEQRYKEFYNDPAITVTPLKDNTQLKDLLSAIRVNFGNLAQGQFVTVTPDGTIQLVGLGSVYLQGLTLDEAKREIDERYRSLVGDGLDATPVLVERAPRYVFVVGEVRSPGQFVLQGPTTISQAIALAGGWNVGANLRQIVVFRRNDDWRLMATRIDLSGALFGERPCPADEIFLRDSDVVLLPKSPLLRTDDWINLVFTRGLYSALPGLSSAYSVKAGQL
ncbi:MAG: hypothetical protein RIS70_3287 [Planctomycetota bacterium]